MRILVTGASGSGTSTLACALAAALNSAWLDTDDYYWMPTQPPFQTKRDRDARTALFLDRLRDSPSAVVSGSLVDWGAELEDAFDRIVFLTVPTAVRLERLVRRETTLHGRANPEFLAWAEQYEEGRLPGRSLAVHERWLAARHCPILRLDGDQPVTEILPIVLKSLASTPTTISVTAPRTDGH